MKTSMLLQQPITQVGLALTLTMLFSVWIDRAAAQRIEADRAGALKSANSKPSELFPPEVEVWLKDPASFEQGLGEANQLRLKLLNASATQVAPLQRIADGIAGLQTALIREELAKLTIPIVEFECSADRLTRQLSGSESLAMDSFSKFDGHWFGKWGDSEVNHDWRPTQLQAKPRFYPDSAVHLSAQQYAWISNGFGWNYLASVDGNNQTHYVLGMVYYFAPPNFRKITDRKAHVGFVDSPTRLVWITDREIFLEEIFEAGDREKEHYVITAIYHDLLGAQPSLSSTATQATYTRDPDNRPAFRSFNWK